MAENVSACKMGTLRSDRGGEYVSPEFNANLAEHGIKHQYIVPYFHEQQREIDRESGRERE
jgi:hypothetical protein